MRNAGRALSRYELLDQVWGKDWIGDQRTLDVHIRWLRLKIEEDPAIPLYIQTVRGHGYRFAGTGRIDIAAASAAGGHMGITRIRSSEPHGG